MDKDALEKLVKEGKSQREIASVVGKSQTTVEYWLKKYSLSTSRAKFNTGYVRPCKCSCGETSPDKFYGHKKSICGECHNQYTKRVGQAKRVRAIEYLGGECLSCGFDKYPCSIDFHHLDPSQKDSKFRNLRSWSWERIKKEIAKCILLCGNCHTAYHAGHDITW